MKTDNILASLCYFSVFFAPFLFPIIVYFLTKGVVREHAGKSLWLHIIPYISLFLGIGIGSLVLGIGQTIIGIIIMIVGGLIGVYCFILNLVKGIKVLID